MEFDNKLMNSLASNLHPQGNLLYGDTPQRTEQLRFLTEVIQKVKPRHIVETGTHWAGFCYFVLMLDKTIQIDTFGINEGSQEAVNILNEYFKVDNVRFHLGDSCKTFSVFTPEYPVDFAWIDGGHKEEICFSDLCNCARLKIKHVCCDDYDLSKLVKAAVTQFLFEKPEYRIEGMDKGVDKRRIVYLKRQ